MAERLVFELRGVGLTPVLLVHEREPGDMPDLEALRQQANSLAIFDVVTEDANLTVWVPVPGSALPVKAELSWPADDTVAEAMVGAQAVELLRAGLLQAKADQLGQEASRMTLAELALAVGRPGGQRTSLSIGTRGTVGTFSAGPQASIALGARIPIAGRLSGTIGTSLPYLRAHYAEAAGDVYFGLARAELGAAVRLAGPAAAWSPDIGASVGLTWMGFSFQPNPLYLGRDDRRLVRGTAGLRGGVSTPRVGPFGGRFDLHLDGGAPVAVALDGVPAGGWGPVQLGLGVALDVLL